MTRKCDQFEAISTKNGIIKLTHLLHNTLSKWIVLLLFEPGSANAQYTGLSNHFLSTGPSFL